MNLNKLTRTEKVRELSEVTKLQAAVDSCSHSHGSSCVWIHVMLRERMSKISARSHGNKHATDFVLISFRVWVVCERVQVFMFP